MSLTSVVPEEEIRDLIAATILRIPGPLGITVASQLIGLRLLASVLDYTMTRELQVLLAKVITAKGEIAAILSKDGERLGFKKFPANAMCEAPSDVFHTCRVGFIYLNANYDTLPSSFFKKTWSQESIRVATGKYDALLTKYEQDLDQLGQAEVAAQDLRDADKLLNMIINGLLGDELYCKLSAQFDRVRAILMEFIPVATTDLSHMTLN